MNVWTEHRNPEGRTYWFNTGTKESVWEKPEDLKSPFEKALNQTKWKEYFSGGRKYYYNTETKESKWDMPEELVVLMENVEAAPPAAAPLAIAAPGFTPIGSGASASNDNMQLALNTYLTPTSQQALPIPTRPNLPEDPVIPHNGFTTPEDAEKAFFHLLRKANVEGDWTWDQGMRAIITDPLYKSYNTLAEKKAAFEKFTSNLRAKEAEEKEARLAKLRPALRNMLKGNPNVFHYSTFVNADKLFAQHPIWQQAKVESERRMIFEEYVDELKQREVQETRNTRTRSISKLVSLLKSLSVVTVFTKWREALKLIQQSVEWNTDAELRQVPMLDLLLAFEDYSRLKEREYEDLTRKEEVNKRRKERKCREAFRELLKELVDAGDIKAGTKWKHIYHKVEKDERYLNMLGQSGSNQLELFWDVVDGLDRELDSRVDHVLDALNDKEGGGGVTVDTTEDDFMQKVQGIKMGKEELLEVYHTLHERALRKQADEKRRAERKARHMQDDLRYALKKLQDPIDLNMDYEDAVPIMAHLPEFKALEGDEEGRKAAYDKFIRRQKERQREGGSEDGGSTGTKRKDYRRSAPEKSSTSRGHRSSHRRDDERETKRPRRDEHPDSMRVDEGEDETQAMRVDHNEPPAATARDAKEDAMREDTPEEGEI